MTKEKLKSVRLDMGLTVKAMADKLSTPKRTYEHWEYGTRRIPGILWVAIKNVKK